jgi:Uma2 family endonuclease
MDRMADPIRSTDTRYSYGDYRRWSDRERWELIDGVPYDMSPAPSRRHQEIAYEIVRQIAPQLEEKPCRAYFAPFDVRLPAADESDDEIDTVVQPDYLIVCDREKLDDAGMRGAPDFVVEILSPSTMPKDLRVKTGLYERHGVREYWAIHPADEVVYIFILAERTDGSSSFGEPLIRRRDGTLELESVPGVIVDLARLFS